MNTPRSKLRGVFIFGFLYPTLNNETKFQDKTKKLTSS